MSRGGIAILPVVLVLGGCAGVAEVTGTASQEDLMQLRADVSQLQLAVQRARAETEKQTSTVDSRLAEQNARSQRQADDLVRRLDALTTSVTSLGARVDELATRVDALSRRAAATATPPAAPPAAPPVPRPAPPSGSPATASSGNGSGTPSGAPATPGSLQPQDVYQAAYIDFSKGSYPLSIAGFREFLRRFPDHALAANAQYWIGEAHVSMARSQANANQPDKAREELERAVQEFRKVVANYPRAAKAPTALYKEALALVELKQPALAQSRLQYLIENFPQAEETPLARERLTALRGG